MPKDQDTQATMKDADTETRKLIKYFHYGWKLGDRTVSKISRYIKRRKLNKKDALKAEQMIANAIAICFLSDYLSMFAPEEIESVCKNVADRSLEIVKEAKQKEAKQDEDQNLLS
ncbi:MAG: hypothetical protein ACLVB9_12295 [Acutalibacteraceae bacterium]